MILAAGDPGKLFVLQDRFAAKGSVLSEVIDAKLISKFGSISWQADVPKGTKLTVAIRAGNVAEPDETWSEWSAEMDDPKASTAKTPPAGSGRGAKAAGGARRPTAVARADAEAAPPPTRARKK